METFATFLCCLLLGLIVLAMVPAALANAHPQALRRLVTGMICLELVLAVLLAAASWAGGGIPLSLRVVDAWPSASVHFGVYYDGVTGLMLLLVAFIGFVVSRFSIRYLEGETTQGRYFQWMGFTVGAVSLMAISGNLLQFFAAWVLTSWGLHQLLLHYRHRPAARRAAWTKFAISRLGDAFLIAALVLTFQSFGTFDLSHLLAEARKLAGSESLAASQSAIAWLLMLGAITKSAQFPFHIWLPDTMETPTPVSALMHAGIVNAGGYLVIRMSPLFALGAESLLVLALIGAVTACFASVVMITQPSVKRALAYSTIAQMGFMMLQCGLGAFSAAMLHIIAHSLYKAHAFLSSGSVVSQSRSTDAGISHVSKRAASTPALFGAAAVTLSAYLSLSVGLDLGGHSKPGGFLLAFVFFLSLTAGGWPVFSFGRRSTTLVGIVGIVGMSLAYVVSYLLIDRWLHPVLPAVAFPASSLFVAVGIAVLFALLFVLHVILKRGLRLKWLAPLRIHAVNGFYVDAMFHRIFSTLAKS
ncbi:MAG: proton-conducting transporter membrane subunit [Pirellulaceae bacterium]